jgi:hypothetical protein
MPAAADQGEGSRLTANQHNVFYFWTAMVVKRILLNYYKEDQAAATLMIARIASSSNMGKGKMANAFVPFGDTMIMKPKQHTMPWCLTPNRVKIACGLITMAYGTAPNFVRVLSADLDDASLDGCCRAWSEGKTLLNGEQLEILQDQIVHIINYLFTGKKLVKIVNFVTGSFLGVTILPKQGGGNNNSFNPGMGGNGGGAGQSSFSKAGSFPFGSGTAPNGSSSFSFGGLKVAEWEVLELSPRILFPANGAASVGASTKQLDIDNTGAKWDMLFKGPIGDSDGDSDSENSVAVSVPDEDPILSNWNEQVEKDKELDEIMKLMSDQEEEARLKRLELLKKNGEDKPIGEKEKSKLLKQAYETSFSEAELTMYLSRLVQDYGIKEDVDRLERLGVTRVDAVRAAMYSKYREEARKTASSSLRDYYHVRGRSIRLESDVLGGATEGHPLIKYSQFEERIEKDNAEIKDRPRKAKSMLQVLSGAQSEYEEEDLSAPALAAQFSKISGEVVTVDTAMVASSMAGKKDKMLGVGTTTSLRRVDFLGKIMKFETKNVTMLSEDKAPITIEEALKASPVITTMMGSPLSDERHLFTGTRLYKKYKLFGIGPHVEITLTQLLRTRQDHPDLSITQVCERIMINEVRGKAESST